MNIEVEEMIQSDIKNSTCTFMNNIVSRICNNGFPILEFKEKPVFIDLNNEHDKNIMDESKE